MEKKIPIYEPILVEYTSLTSKKKPQKKLVTDRKVKVFVCAPMRDGKVYSGYPQCPSFSGHTYKELLENIEQYLQKTITMINEPLVDCPHCKGTGVCIS